MCALYFYLLFVPLTLRRSFAIQHTHTHAQHFVHTHCSMFGTNSWRVKRSPIVSRYVCSSAIRMVPIENAHKLTAVRKQQPKSMIWIGVSSGYKNHHCVQINKHGVNDVLDQLMRFHRLNGALLLIPTFGFVRLLVRANFLPHSVAYAVYAVCSAIDISLLSHATYNDFANSSRQVRICSNSFRWTHKINGRNEDIASHTIVGQSFVPRTAAMRCVWDSITMLPYELIISVEKFSRSFCLVFLSRTYAQVSLHALYGSSNLCSPILAQEHSASTRRRESAPGWCLGWSQSKSVFRAERHPWLSFEK